MELVCNELSLYPLVSSEQEAENLFRDVLKTFSAFKSKYGFRHIRFPLDFYRQQVTSTFVYSEWLNTIVDKTLKNAVIALIRKPFSDDLEGKELEEFFSSDYAINHEDTPHNASPIGLPVAYILGMPALSFKTHNFWQKRKIQISKTNTEKAENGNFMIYNVCSEADIDTPEFAEWTEISMSERINSADTLRKYLNFTKYSVDFTDDFLRQLFKWKAESGKTYKYTLRLMKDVQLHPFAGGMGQTENLKKRGKEGSKRITNSYPDGDRLSYFLENNKITFVACKGHYDFHRNR